MHAAKTFNEIVSQGIDINANTFENLLRTHMG